MFREIRTMIQMINTYDHLKVYQRCTVCLDTKPLFDNFAVDNSRPTGYRRDCKECRNKQQEEYRNKRAEMKQALIDAVAELNSVEMIEALLKALNEGDEDE